MLASIRKKIDRPYQQADSAALQFKLYRPKIKYND